MYWQFTVDHIVFVGTGDTSVTKTDQKKKELCPQETYILVGGSKHNK